MNNSCNFNILSLQLSGHRIAVSVIASLSAITATFLNSIVLYSIWKAPSLHKPSYLLIASLALTDFISGSIVQSIKVVSNISALMSWSQVFCDSWLVQKAVGYWMGAVSLFTITLISIDRLLAIRLKTRYRTVVTLKRTALLLAFWWIGGALFSMSTLFLSQLPIRKLVIVIAFYQSLLLILLAACYSSAFYSLKKLASSVSSNTAPANATMDNEQTNFNLRKYRRSFNTMLIVVTCVMVFYLQHVCSAIITDLTMTDSGQGFRQERSSVISYKLLGASEVIVGINSSVNPLLYLWRMNDLREAVETALRRIFRKVPSNQLPQQQPR